MLEKIKRVPFLNAESKVKHNQKEFGEVVIYVDNSKDGSANVVYWNWSVQKKNGDYYKGKWKPFFGKENVYGKRTYIPGNCFQISSFDRFDIEPGDTLNDFDKLLIWIHYEDDLERKWLLNIIFRVEGTDCDLIRRNKPERVPW